MAQNQHDRRLALLDLVEPICDAHGVELVDVRLAPQPDGAVLKVIIDRAAGDAEATDVSGSGVTLTDCTSVSRDLSTSLDVHEELVPGAYRLEVSSPGLDRPLVKPTDFERFAGREIKIQTRQRIGNKRRFHGTLLGIENEAVQIKQDGEAIEIPLDQIARANLAVRF